MTIDETSARLDCILKELEQKNSKVETFYFTSLDSNNGVDESRSFDDLSDVAIYLHKMSLTHGIFTCCMLRSGSISSILCPLNDYSIPEIDDGIVGRFLKMK